jgi:hypothetical protein
MVSAMIAAVVMLPAWTDVTRNASKVEPATASGSQGRMRRRG